MNSPEKMTDWICGEAERLCRTYPDRLAGSDSDRRCSRDMAGQLERWADTVTTENFRLHPKAFMGSIPLQGGLAAAAVICTWLSVLTAAWIGWIAFALALTAFVSWVFEYILYIPLFDRLYPSAESQNVYARLKPAGETTRRIVLAAHSDAAWEQKPFLKEQTLPLVLAMFFADSGIVLTMVCAVLAALGRLTRVFAGVMAVYSVCTFLSDLYFIDFMHWKTVSPGAVDNLSGCVTVMSILRELAENGQRLRHTEISVVITGGEEAGLRGADAFARAHRQELSDPDTWVIAVDTLMQPDMLMAYPRGINWTQRNSSEVCGMLRRAGEDCGVKVGLAGPYPGATDAEAFSRQGIRAAALCGLSHTPSRYYHTRYDAPDRLNAEAIRAGRTVLMALIRRVDKEGKK